MVLDYSSDEIAVVRRAIAPPPPKPPEGVIEAMRPAAGMPVPDHMPPFWNSENTGQFLLSRFFLRSKDRS